MVTPCSHAEPDPSPAAKLLASLIHGPLPSQPACGHSCAIRASFWEPQGRTMGRAAGLVEDEGVAKEATVPSWVGASAPQGCPAVSGHTYRRA